MNLELRDIHLPETDMLWWPLAAGWYVLCLLFVVALVLLVCWRKRRPKKPKVKAKPEMRKLYQAYRQHQNQHQFMQELSVLMRRVCLRHFSAKDFASLQGQAWLTWLDQSTDGQVVFSQGIGESLITGPYNRQQQVDVQQLYKLCKRWLKVVEKN